MEIKYFETFQLDVAMGLVTCTEDTLKNEYRRLAIKLHPDKGGSNEHFKAMKFEYEYIRDNLEEFKLSVEKQKINLLEKDKPRDNFVKPEKIVVTSQSTLGKRLTLLSVILVTLICSFVIAGFSFWSIPIYMAFMDCIKYEQRSKMSWLFLIMLLFPFGVIGYEFRRRNRHKLPNWKPINS